jgi:hypothetical protein
VFELPVVSEKAWGFPHTGAVLPWYCSDYGQKSKNANRVLLATGSFSVTFSTIVVPGSLLYYTKIFIKCKKERVWRWGGDGVGMG